MGQLLSAMGIEPDGDERVVPPLQTPLHPSAPVRSDGVDLRLTNGRTVTVVINDRGPFGGRIIDLSHDPIAVLAPLSQGACEVRLTW